MSRTGFPAIPQNNKNANTTCLLLDDDVARHDISDKSVPGYRRTRYPRVSKAICVLQIRLGTMGFVDMDYFCHRKSYLVQSEFYLPLFYSCNSVRSDTHGACNRINVSDQTPE